MQRAAPKSESSSGPSPPHPCSWSCKRCVGHNFLAITLPAPIPFSPASLLLERPLVSQLSIKQPALIFMFWGRNNWHAACAQKPEVLHFPAWSSWPPAVPFIVMFCIKQQSLIPVIPCYSRKKKRRKIAFMCISLYFLHFLFKEIQEYLFWK